MKIELGREQRIYLIVCVVASVLLAFGFLSGIKGVLGNIIILVALLFAAPYLLLRYEKYREMKELEERFPDFLRSLSESIYSGIPMHKAIVDASQTDYGKALSREIKKMSSQLSWGMTLDKVLEQFARRVPTKRIKRGIRIINEAQQTGADVASVINSVADNIMMLEEAERERKSVTSHYVVLMYAISLIFIVIVSVISKFLLPIFEAGIGMEGEMGFRNPCDVCRDVECLICSFYGGVAEGLLGVEIAGVGSYYAALFFLMALVQSTLAGLIAGVISEQRLIAGVKHSLILLTLTWGAFLIMIQLGLLG